MNLNKNMVLFIVSFSGWFLINEYFLVPNLVISGLGYGSYFAQVYYSKLIFNIISSFFMICFWGVSYYTLYKIVSTLNPSLSLDRISVRTKLFKVISVLNGRTLRDELGKWQKTVSLNKMGEEQK